MHDLFDVLGLPSNAPIGEIRRVCALRSRRLHPDFRVSSHADVTQHPDLLQREVAVDFVDMACIVPRMEASFFADRS